MKRRDRDIWVEDTDGRENDAAVDPDPIRRRDTDLSEPSVRISRRELGREERSAGRAPWDDPEDPIPGPYNGGKNEEKRNGGNGSGRNGGNGENGGGDARNGSNGEKDGGRNGGDGGDDSGGRNGDAGDNGDKDNNGDKKPRKNTLASVLSGNILSQSEVRRAYPYMIFVACLMFLYIANIFRTQYIYRQHATLTEQVKELRAKSMTIASERMQATQQSNVMIELERRGIPLRESLTPNKVIPNPRRDGEEKNDR